MLNQVGWLINVSGVYSGPVPFLHLSFVEIRSLAFVQFCRQTDQNTTSLVEVKSFYEVICFCLIPFTLHTE